MVVLFKLGYNLPTELVVIAYEFLTFFCLLDTRTMTITMTPARVITTMSTNTTATAMVATLEPPPPSPMGCAVVALGLLIVPRFVVVISVPPAVVMSVVPSSVEVVSCVGESVGSGVVTSIVVASIVVASIVVGSGVVGSVVASSVEHRVYAECM